MIVVIGYGNTLRSDDAAGQIVAQEVEQKKWENVRSLAVHQLTPELAADLSSCELVIFVDAYVAKDKEGVEVRQLSIADDFLTNESPWSFGHTGDGRSLLVLCQALYDRVPQAYWVLVPAINFEFGEQQSPVTERGIIEALATLEQLIKNWVAKRGNLVKSVKLESDRF